MELCLYYRLEHGRNREDIYKSPWAIQKAIDVCMKEKAICNLWRLYSFNLQSIDYWAMINR